MIINTFEELLALPVNTGVVQGKPRNYRFDNIITEWVKVDVPVEFPLGSGNFSWSITGKTADMQVAGDWHVNGFKVREEYERIKGDDGKYVNGEPTGCFLISLRRKTATKDGKARKPVMVFDHNVKPIEDTSHIGNGSTANVNVFQYAWEFMGKTGVSTDLVGVQFTDIIHRSTSAATGFDIVVQNPISDESSGGDDVSPADMF
tara:strand:- start:963 stop:1574 length:612 start_codon:yes stop_codon:yes gene_type:complete